MKNIKNKVITIASTGVLIAALNVTGVFGTFFTEQQDPNNYTCSGYGYQAGYGYGYNCTPIQHQGLGEARGIDVCPGNIDNSGNFYDGLCDASGTPAANNNQEQETNNTQEQDNNTGSDTQEDNNSGNNNQENNNSGNNDTGSKVVTPTTENTINHGDYVTSSKYSSCVIIKAVLDDNFNPTYVNPFVDINNSPYKQTIINFAKAGVVHGTSATTFEPNRGITRAEFLAIVLKTHCYKFDLGSSNPGFPDVSPTSWQAKVVKKGVALGIIHGYSDGTFKPNRVISKAEAYGIVSSLGLVSSKALENTSYTDLEAAWQTNMVKKLEYLGVLNASEDNYKFHPNSAVNRDQMLEFIRKVISLY